MRRVQGFAQGGSAPHVCTSCKGFCALRRVLTLALGLADQGSALGVEQIIPDPISARYDDIPLLERH